jgi:putative drug exporter of the RND superfamily
LIPLLYRLGHFCARHPVWVLAVWLVVALAIVGVARSVGQETNDDLSLPGTDSQAASDLLSNKFPDQANGSVPIAFVINGDPTVKQFGLGMAVAVAVDAPSSVACSYQRSCLC